MKSVWWRMYKNKHRNLGKCQITTGRIIFSWKKLEVEIYKLSALLCSVIFLMEHVMVIFKLKIVNWSTKRPKPVLFTKLFGTENSMSGSKLLRCNFILAPSQFIDISFSSNVPDFLFEWIHGIWERNYNDFHIFSKDFGEIFYNILVPIFGPNLCISSPFLLRPINNFVL